MKLVPITEEHFPAIAEIYQQGINNGFATFETSVPSLETWNESKLPHSSF